MPELPEVERACELLRDSCLNLTVKRFLTDEQGGGPRSGQLDDKFFTDLNIVKQLSSIVGQTLTQVDRKGKYFWLTFELIKKVDIKPSKPTYLIMHFGMTGSLSIKGKKRFQYTDFKVDNKWPPKYCKFEIIFVNDAKIETPVCITDPRRLARLYFTDMYPNSHPKLKALGPDPILDETSAKYVATKCWSYKSPIKSVLLDQSKIFCGIGNYLADEILFQANIHPQAKSQSLSEAQCAELYSKVIQICNEAVRLQGENFPKHWIFHHRWKKMKKNHYEHKLDIDPLQVSFIKVGGRTTCFVPKLQRMGKRKSDSETLKNISSKKKKKISKKST